MSSFSKGKTTETVNVICNDGYNGGGTATCDTDGKFNTLTCLAKTCTATGNVANSNKAATGSITGTTAQTVTVSCNAGYTGGGSTTCGTNGLFNPQGTCTCMKFQDDNKVSGNCLDDDEKHTRQRSFCTNEINKDRCDSAGGRNWVPSGLCAFTSNTDVTCLANTCTCSNGTPTVATGSGGTLCETASTKDCSACDAGYKLSAAPAAGQQTCVSCVAGATYKLSSNTATSCTTCTATCGEGTKKVACTTTADRTCPSCTATTTWQDSTSHSDASCKTCTVCSGGTSQTAQCTTTTDRQCSGNTCTCPNGTPTVSGGSGATLCEAQGNVDCSACGTGYTISATAGLGLQMCNANTCAKTQVANSNKATADSIEGTLNNDP